MQMPKSTKSEKAKRTMSNIGSWFKKRGASLKNSLSRTKGKIPPTVKMDAEFVYSKMDDLSTDVFEVQLNQERRIKKLMITVNKLSELVDQLNSDVYEDEEGTEAQFVSTTYAIGSNSPLSLVGKVMQ